MNKPLSDARQMARETTLLQAKVKREGEAARRVLVRNLSTGGMMIEGHADLVVDDVVVAELPGLGKIAGCIAWTEEDRAGMAFDAPVDPTRARRPRLKLVAG